MAHSGKQCTNLPSGARNSPTIYQDTSLKCLTIVMSKNWTMMTNDHKKRLKDAYSNGLADPNPAIIELSTSGMAWYLSLKVTVSFTHSLTHSLTHSRTRPPKSWLDSHQYSWKIVTFWQIVREKRKRWKLPVTRAAKRTKVQTHSLTHSLSHSLTHSLTHSAYINAIQMCCCMVLSMPLDLPGYMPSIIASILQVPTSSSVHTLTHSHFSSSIYISIPMR